jgi:hypothetical protein
MMEAFHEVGRSAVGPEAPMMTLLSGAVQVLFDGRTAWRPNRPLPPNPGNNSVQ